MKNFSNTKVVLVTTIPAQTQAGMIDYTFLLPGKNDLCKAQFLPETKKVRLVKLIVLSWWRRPVTYVS
jgi:hypothetical protein